MKISEIPLSHFLLEVAEDMKQEHFSALQPYRQKYYKLGHVYLAIGFENNNLSVEYALNSGKTNKGDWVQFLVDLGKSQKNNKIIFCSNDDKVKEIAKKIGATEVNKNGLYVGVPGFMIFELDLR